MILPAHTAKLAANGRATIALTPIGQPRTQTRKGKHGRGTTYTTKPWTPTTGRREPLRVNTNGRTTKIADIIIGAHTTIHLADLLNDKPGTLELVRAAGFKTRAALAREWMRAHDTAQWPPLTEELCPHCQGTAHLHDNQPCPDCDHGAILIETAPTDEQTLERFAARHGHTPVHVITFQLDKTEPTRLLSPAGKPRGDELGYTANPTDAMQDAGEAVPTGYQTKLTAAARNANHKRQQQRIQDALANHDTDALKAEPSRAARRLARSAKRARDYRDAA